MKSAGRSRVRDEQAMGVAGVFTACVGLGICFALLMLSTLCPSIMWRRHSDVLPWASLVCGVLPSIIAVVLSIRMLWRSPSARAWAGLALGLLAFPTCLVITWWLGMMVLASHPA